MKVFVINLASATARRSFQQQQLSKLKLDYQIIRATTASDIDDKTYQKHYYDWQKHMHKTEIACYFSHQKLWQKIIKNNQVALILEDDAMLSKHIPSILEQLEKYTNLDMINLEDNLLSQKYVAKKSQSIIKSNHKLLRLYRHRRGSGGYVLYPSGAKKLLKYQQKNGIAPADVYLNDCPTLRYQIEPVCVVQAMYCQEHGMKQHNIAMTPTNINHKNDKASHTFVFRVKRIIAQVKSWLRKLGFIFKVEKRHIELNNKDFDLDN